MISKNNWVQIKKIILKCDERPNTLPNDTLNCPFTMWVKGFLLDDASLGDTVSVKTITGRIETGELIEVNPTYRHNYGEFIPELLTIDTMVKTVLFGGEPNE